MLHPSLFYRDLSLRYIRDPRLGHRLGRNYPDGKHVDETWGYLWLGTNGNGFYGHDEIVPWGPPKDDVLRVMLLGGSAAMGLGASRRGETIRDHLLGFLSASAKRPVEVLNCAVGDYASSQSLIYFVTELIELEPHIVVALDGWNDFAHAAWGTKYSKGRWLANSTRSFDDNLEAVLMWDGSLSEETLRELKRRRSPRAIRRQRNKQVRSEEATPFARSSHGFVWDNPAEWSVRREAVDWYLRNVHTLAAICASQERKLLQVLQPAMVWPTANARAGAEQKVLEVFNERMPRLADLAAEHYDQLAPRFDALQMALQEREFAGKPDNIAVCDGSQWLLARTDDCYFDPMHFNDRGQREVAILLFAEIDKRGWLQ